MHFVLCPAQYARHLESIKTKQLLIEHHENINISKQKTVTQIYFKKYLIYWLHCSVATLNSLTGEVNDIDYIVNGICQGVGDIAQQVSSLFLNFMCWKQGKIGKRSE